MISSMIYREKSRRREIVPNAQATRSSSVENFVKLYGSGTRSPVPTNPSSRSVERGRRSSLQKFDGSERHSYLERSPSSSSIVKYEGSPSRASLNLSLWKAFMLANAPLEISPPPVLDGSGVPLHRNLWKRRSSVALEPGKSRLGRSSSQVEIDKMISREKLKAEANNNSSTTASSARSRSRSRSPGPSLAEVEEIIDRESRNTDEYTSLSPLIKFQRSNSGVSEGPSRAEVEEIIDRESRNTDEYTSLSPLIKFQRSNSGVSEPPVVRDTIVEKAAAVYLRASFSRNSRTEDFSSGFWNSVCRIVTAWIPAFSCLGWSDEIPDPGYY